MYLDDNIYGEILQDENYKNKKIDWKGRKEKNLVIAESFNRLKYSNRSIRLSECSTLLQFLECPHDGSKKLIRGNFCRDRLCPTCNSRRSTILQYQLSDTLKELYKQRKGKVSYIFLTLTVKNVKGKDLKKTLDNMTRAFNRFFKYKALNDVSLGYIRTLEITRNTDKNSKDYNTYHPHFHVLIAVEPEYYKSKEYLKQQEIANLWKKALKVSYTPIVDVRKAKPNVRKGRNSLTAAILEVAKYSVKDTDYICDTEKETDEVIKVLASALKGRRLIGFSKLFRDIRKQLHLQDVESDDVDLIVHSEQTNKCNICGRTMEKTLYNWYTPYKNYFRLHVDNDEEMERIFCSTYLYKNRRLSIEKNKKLQELKAILDKSRHEKLKREERQKLLKEQEEEKKNNKPRQLTLFDFGFI